MKPPNCGIATFMLVTVVTLIAISQPVQGAEHCLLQTSKIKFRHNFSGYVFTNQEDDEQQDLCSRNTKHFTPLKLRKKCPRKCPFSQRLPGDHCHKVCVRDELCRAFHPLRSFADQESKACVATCGKEKKDHVVGCAVCLELGRCKTCHSGFFLTKNGHCAESLSIIWQVVYSVLAILVILLALYLFDLRNRPVINDDVLHHGLEHRDERKVWVKKADDDMWHQHKVSETAVLHTDVSGQGILLYFGFLKFAVAMAFVLLLATSVTYRFSNLAIQTDEANDCRSSKFDVTQKDAYQSYYYSMFLAMAAIYTTVLVSSLVHVWYQTNASYRWDEMHATHEDYALRMSGLPSDATDPSEIKDFFAHALQTVVEEQKSISAQAQLRSEDDDDHKIIGVSIAYDYKEHEKFIQNCIDDWVADLEIAAGRRDWKHRPPSSTALSSGDVHSSFQFSPVRVLDYFFWGSCGDAEDIVEVDPASCRQVLTSLKCSGTAYVICSAPEVLDLLYPFFRRGNAPLFRGKHEIKLFEVWSEPPGLTWENFTKKNFWPSILLGGLLLLATIALWLCLYLPYALSVTHTLRIPGSEPGFLEGNLLGLLIALGNAIVSQVVDLITTWAGFAQKDRRDIAVMSLAFLATLLNTGFDIWMVLKIAQRSELANAFEATNDHIVARELMSIIVPGYLILPYIAMPAVEHVLPYFLGKWLVRSKKANIRQAEKLLECPEFDICWRYSDILNNFTICLLMLTVVSPRSHQVMCWLLVFLFLIFGIDKYKLLRATSQTFYTTSRLEDAAQFLWALPSGLLASITVGWACSVHVQVLPHDNEMFLSILAFVVHVVMYTLLCKLVRSCVKPPETETTTYEDMCDYLKAEGKVWSYFNTNPIFCLRSKYLDVVEPGVGTYPCVPFIPGKQFLQPGVPKRFKHKGLGVFKATEKFVTAFIPVTPPHKKKERKALSKTEPQPCVKLPSEPS
jgi:hypothetical protein